MIALRNFGHLFRTFAFLFFNFTVDSTHILVTILDDKLTNTHVFGAAELDFLGHKINRQGVTPLPQKVQVIRDFPQPKSPRQLRRFIGLVYIYHRFLPHCAELMIPLHALLSSCKPKSQSLSWSDNAIAAFHATKKALAAASLLCYPQSDAPTSLATDASDTAIGAVLQQHIEGAWCPISFFSRKLTPAETRYSAFDKELLAIYLAIQHFRHFLEGRPFQVLTDHKPLTFALNSRSDHHSPRQARQLDYISQFTSESATSCLFSFFSALFKTYAALPRSLQQFLQLIAFFLLFRTFAFCYFFLPLETYTAFPRLLLHRAQIITFY